MTDFLQTTEGLRSEVTAPGSGMNVCGYYSGLGFKAHLNDPIPVARAWALRYLLRDTKKTVYRNDIIAGSMRGMFAEDIPESEIRYYREYTDRFGRRNFVTKADHFAPAYERLLQLGVDGILEEIRVSRENHGSERRKKVFLDACEISMLAFREMIEGYAEAASDEVMKTCLENVAHKAPSSFREALQLVWLCMTVFHYQELYAVALGRLDQYLYPFYRADLEKGRITQSEAQVMFENVFMKIGEWRTLFGGDDVCNIAVAGITPKGENAVNDLTYAILRAVRQCNIPGPNLSARIHPLTPDDFLEEALTVIGTGLGYPALMNDTVNIAALKHMGYSEEDCNGYCMVGCIENFLPGMQPPWSDGRFDTVKLLELTLNHGRDLLSGAKTGKDVGGPEDWKTMDDLLAAYTDELEDGAAEYVNRIRLAQESVGNDNQVNPFLSCVCYHCVERGLDINNGGSRYPAAHGACAMGIGTIADSLAAIEKCVYVDRSVTWEELTAALRANFEGFEAVREKLLAAPKYGNDDDFADKYAVWFVRQNCDIFDRYTLDDGGRFYTAIASNVSNIPAGRSCGASPDGRLAGEPQSDAASPTYGRDHRGPTRTVKSVSKPDYSRIACGTVVNQKYSPAIFSDTNNIKRLAALIRVYFKRGGQEMQINSVSREVLMDAMEHPEKYRDLVVRVSGFSAYFVTLDRSVQQDILNRTVQY